jgi:hypothetical protein
MSVLSMVSIMQRIKDLYEKIATREVLAIVVVVVMALLTSGVIYVLVQAPGALASTSSGGSSFVSKSSSSSTSTEMFVTFILTIIGASGFIILEGALKKSYDLTGTKIRYLIAVVMIVLSISLLEGIAYIKIH